MTKVIADISMSLDGFVTGPGPDPDLEHGLGHGGEPLHTWAIDSDDPVDAAVLGAGTPLFTGDMRRQLVQRDVRVSSHATHLIYEPAMNPQQIS